MCVKPLSLPHTADRAPNVVAIDWRIIIIIIIHPQRHCARLGPAHINRNYVYVYVLHQIIHTLRVPMRTVFTRYAFADKNPKQLRCRHRSRVDQTHSHSRTQYFPSAHRAPIFTKNPTSSIDSINSIICTSIYRKPTSGTHISAQLVSIRQLCISCCRAVVDTLLGEKGSPRSQRTTIQINSVRRPLGDHQHEASPYNKKFQTRFGRTQSFMHWPKERSATFCSNWLWRMHTRSTGRETRVGLPTQLVHEYKL